MPTARRPLLGADGLAGLQPALIPSDPGAELDLPTARVLELLLEIGHETFERLDRRGVADLLPAHVADQRRGFSEGSRHRVERLERQIEMKARRHRDDDGIDWPDEAVAFLFTVVPCRAMVNLPMPPPIEPLLGLPR